MIAHQKMILSLLKQGNVLALVGLVLLVASCHKQPDDNPENRHPLSLGRGFYVVNEGNFTMGNATLSYFQADSGKMLQNIFFIRNNVPLGDVAQSMAFWKKSAFVVVNNSGIIWKINAETAEIEGKMAGMASPRFVCVIDDNKAVISDFQEKALRIFNPQNLETEGYIHLGRTAEHILFAQGKLFVANWSAYGQTAENNTVQVIDPSRNMLIDSIIVTKEPNSMVIDRNQKLWVLCSGGYLNEEYPALYRINANTHEIERTFVFAEKTISPEQLSINASGDTLYFLNQGVWRMTVDATALPQNVFVASGQHNFYRLAVDPFSSQLLVTDAGNFQQKGYIFRYRPDGTQIDSLTAGVIPGFIGFNSNL